LAIATAFDADSRFSRTVARRFVGANRSRDPADPLSKLRVARTPKTRKSPAATAGLFDFRKQPTRVFRKKCDQNTPELFSGRRPG